MPSWFVKEVAIYQVNKERKVTNAYFVLLIVSSNFDLFTRGMSLHTILFGTRNLFFFFKALFLRFTNLTLLPVQKGLDF